MQSLYFLSNFLNFLFTCLLSFFFLPEAIFYKIYIVYRDVITLLIFGLVSFTIISVLVKLLLVRYSIACLRLFVVILQDLHCLQRFYHNVDHWGIKLYHHTNFHMQPSFC